MRLTSSTSKTALVAVGEATKETHCQKGVFLKIKRIDRAKNIIVLERKYMFIPKTVHRRL